MFPRILILVLAAVLLVGYAARPSGGAGREHVYVVQPGDTLWSIAAHTSPGDTRVGVWGIERRNGLASATIVPGQRLVVP
jgi:LysM repeat protein